MTVDKLELIIQNDCLRRDLEFETKWRTAWKQAAKKYKRLFFDAAQSACELADTADKRLELLRRSKDWLESYLEYLDTDIPLLDEPNKSVAKLIDELAEELGEREDAG